MIEKNRGKGDNAEDAQLICRPVRPFLTGVSIAAAWGAYHLPGTISASILGAFTAELVAIAIVTGGAIAIVIEVIVFTAARLRRTVGSLSNAV